MIPFSQSEKKIRKDRKKSQQNEEENSSSKKLFGAFPKKKLIKLDKSDPEAKKEAWIRFLVFECVKVSNYINFTSFHQ